MNAAVFVDKLELKGNLKRNSYEMVLYLLWLERKRKK